MKRCSKCNIEKELSEFSKDSRTKSGFRCHCKKCASTYFKTYRSNNVEKDRIRCTVYKKQNRSKLREYDNSYKKKRRQQDPIFKMRHNIRTRFTKLMNGQIKDKKFEEIIGLSPAALLDYLEQFFEPGMTRENNTKLGWHIDHTIPLSSATTIEEMYKLWHHTNLRPMWAHDNWSKGSSLQK